MASSFFGMLGVLPVAYASMRTAWSASSLLVGDNLTVRIGEAKVANCPLDHVHSVATESTVVIAAASADFPETLCIFSNLGLLIFEAY